LTIVNTIVNIKLISNLIIYLKYKMVEGRMYMTNQADLARIFTVAKLYYEENLTQAEVAERVGVSRPLVSKMLSEARECGIVHIEVRNVVSGNRKLLQALVEKFGLVGGLVVPNAKTAAVQRHNLYEQAGHYLVGETSNQKNLGVGWGTAINELMWTLSRQTVPSVNGTIFPLIGEANIPNKGYHTNEIVTMLANYTGRKARLLYAPAFPDNVEERKLYISSSSFEDLNVLWEKIDAAMVAVYDYPTVPDECTSERFGDVLKEKRAVGNLLSYFYDVKGNIIYGKNDCAIHISLDKLRNSKKVICFVEKATPQAVYGALKTGLLTHIILTEQIAEQVLAF